MSDRERLHAIVEVLPDEQVQVRAWLAILEAPVSDEEGPDISHEELKHQLGL